MRTTLSDPSGGDGIDSKLYGDDSDEAGDDLSDLDSLFDEPMDGNVPSLYINWPTITVPPDLERQAVVDCITTWFLNHPPGNHDSPLDLDSFLETCSFNDVNQVIYSTVQTA